MRLMRVLPAGILAVLVGSSIARADGWSLLHPFSTTTTPAKPAKPVSRTTAKEPSVGEKVGAGTKKFFSGIGNALTLKKTETKRSVNPYSSQGWTSSAKSKQAKQSPWWNPFYKEPPKPKSLSDFVGMPRPE